MTSIPIFVVCLYGRGSVKSTILSICNRINRWYSARRKGEIGGEGDEYISDQYIYSRKKPHKLMECSVTAKEERKDRAVWTLFKTGQSQVEKRLRLYIFTYTLFYSVCSSYVLVLVPNVHWTKLEYRGTVICQSPTKWHVQDSEHHIRW